MNKYHQQSSAPTAAIVIVVVLVLAVLLLGGCALVGLMFYRNATHKAMVAREHAMMAKAQARKAAEMERERAENLKMMAQTARRHADRLKTSDATASPKAELDVTELQIAFDAEGHMSMAGQAMDREQVKDRLEQLAGQPPSRVVILADQQCRMEPVLKLLQAAEECKVEVTISTSHLDTEGPD